MNRFLPSCLIACVLCLFTTAPCLAADGQPHMKAALEFLQTAKKADNPLPSLKAAKKHLANAKKNKGGAIGQAMDSLNEAIALATLGGEKDKLEQKINATIANVQNGIANGK